MCGPGVDTPGGTGTSDFTSEGPADASSTSTTDAGSMSSTSAGRSPAPTPGCEPWLEGDVECQLYKECFEGYPTLECQYGCLEGQVCKDGVCMSECAPDTNGLGPALCDPWGVAGNGTFVCGQVCENDDDCDQPPDTEAKVWCGPKGVCLLNCGRLEDEVECPEGLTCNKGTCSNSEV